MKSESDFIQPKKASMILGVSKQRFLYIAATKNLVVINTDQGRLFLKKEVLRLQRARRAKARRELAQNTEKAKLRIAS